MLTRKRGFRNPLAGIIGGPIAVIIGIVVALFGWNIRAQTVAFVQNASRANGTVVAVVPVTKIENNQEKTLFYPVIEFVTEDGETIRYQDSTGSNPPRHKVGDQVQVLYDPQNPKHAQEESFLSLWLPSTALLSMGGLFVLFGVLGFFNSLLWLVGIAGLLGIGTWLLARRKKDNQ